MKAYVEPEKCIRCNECSAVRGCSIRAIFRISVEDPTVVDPKLCRGCGDCIAKCPAKAIILKNG